MSGGDEFCHVPHVQCVTRSCGSGPARGSAYRTAHSCRANVWLQCTAPGRRGVKGEKISSDGTASGGPVQPEKLRRTRVSMQASRNRHAGIARGV